MPPSMAELTSLRTLSLLVVGGVEEKNSFQLFGLQHLNHLRGKLSIEHLERVREGKDPEKVNLEEKQNLQELSLAWDIEDGDGDDDDDDDDDEQEQIKILEALQPPPGLRVLKLVGYKGTSFLTLWRLPFLERLTLKNLPNLKFMFASSQDFYGEGFVPFPSLQYLSLQNLPGLEKITSGEEEEEEQELNDRNCSIFPHLSELKIEFCPQMKSLSFPLPSLRSVTFSESDGIMLSTFASFSSSFKPQTPNCLQKLDISHSSLESFPEQIFQTLTSLRTLTIRYCVGLKSLPKSIQSLSSLLELTISYCVELEDLSFIFFHLTSLQKLVLTNLFFASLDCLHPNLIELPSLRYLELELLILLDSLPNWLPQLVSLEELRISGCTNLTAIPDSIRQLDKLVVLKIKGCPILEEQCEEEVGEDWDKIAHIPDITIS